MLVLALLAALVDRMDIRVGDFVMWIVDLRADEIAVEVHHLAWLVSRHLLWWGISEVFQRPSGKRTGGAGGLTSQSRLGQSRTITSASPMMRQLTFSGGGPVGAVILKKGLKFNSMGSMGLAVARVAAERSAAVAMRKCIAIVKAEGGVEV